MLLVMLACLLKDGSVHLAEINVVHSYRNLAALCFMTYLAS